MTEVAKLVESIYAKRDSYSRKYDYGHLLIIGGSKMYSGAPAFNALAALRCGVDMVTVAAVERPADIIAGFSPDLVTYPLEGDYFTRKHIKEIFGINRRFSACVIGSGIGNEKETVEAVCEFLEKTDLPCVIDADAIHAVASKPEVLKGKSFLLTPNRNEFRSLIKSEVAQKLEAEIEATKKVAREFGCVILYKGIEDIISDGQQAEINMCGSPFMTKGGTGDLLAGVCGAIIARKVPCFETALAAAYINGRAGELAGEKHGESMLASDVLEEYHKIINL
ncbi:MAG TPA: NAD(P)H-hydrate dehydratase [Methanotrichaceae archaeon]|nr:NAD(P)H-hydrate dehydratase [Methanotrichaceae archaeon]